MNEQEMNGTIPSTMPAPSGRMARRQTLVWLIRFGAAAFVLAFSLPALALRTLTQVSKTIAPGDVLVYATGSQAGQPLNASDLQPGGGVQVFPQGKTDSDDNLVELVRIAPGTGADGLVAYSAICTHLGCVVASQLNAQGQIACPCHGSRFDPANGGAVVGGPASRPLPALPIQTDSDGTVVVAGAFSGPIGPQ
jgi:rieske iron-sulfur protein